MRRSCFLFSALALAACDSQVIVVGAGGSGAADATTNASTGTGSTKASSSASTGGGCTDGIQCPAPADACSIPVCDAGVCGSAPAPDGTACDDGLFCTSDDHCEAGVCAGKTPTTCPGSGGCTIGVCDEATKACTVKPGNEGGPCDDLDPCTGDGVCMGGQCYAAPPIDCSMLDTACSVGTCGPEGCHAQPINEGGACSDSNGCTVGDHCQMGVCLGGISVPQYFFDDFHDASQGWQLGPEWQIGPAMTSSGQNYGNPDPATDHSSTSDNGVAGVVIGGNEQPMPTHPFSYLVSPAFDTSNATGQVILGYYRYLNSDYDPWMHDTVDVWDGSQWVNLFTSGSAPGVLDADWTFVQHDVTAYKNAEMRVRFGFDITNQGAFTVSSWNVDDVRVADAACP